MPPIQSSTVFIVLPVYDEGQAISTLIDRIGPAIVNNPENFEILVIDDGSHEKTAAILDELNCSKRITLLRHERNKGLSDTIETAVAWLRDRINDDDSAVFMDGDDTHSPRTVLKLLESQKRGNAVTVASRYCPEAKTIGVGRFRKVLSILANSFFRVCFPIPNIRDYSCGFRCISGSTLIQLQDNNEGKLFELSKYNFICTLELIYKLSEITDRFSEVPIDLDYRRKTRESKLNLPLVSIGLVLLTWNLLLGKIQSGNDQQS